MRPPENLTTSTIDTSTTSKHFSSMVAKRQGQQDDNAHSQSVSKHHQQVDELDVSRPGFREVPANVTRITAGTRSAAAPPPNQPQAAPLNRRRPPTRKSKKKNRLGDNSDSGSESDSTKPLANNNDYSASRPPEAAPEVPEAPAEYPRNARQKGFDWMLRLKKAGQTCEEFHEQCDKHRGIGRERLEELANEPHRFQQQTTFRGFPYPSASLANSWEYWDRRSVRTSLKIWESRRRAHFDKMLYSYFQATLGNDCPMETPIDMIDTLQEVVEAVEAEMVHCLGHFHRFEDTNSTDPAAGIASKTEVICKTMREMYRTVATLSPVEELISEETEPSTAINPLKQKIRAIQVPEMSTVGRITRAYVSKIIGVIEKDYNDHQASVARLAVNDLDLEHMKRNYDIECDGAMRRLAYRLRHLEPIDYLSWILDTSDKDMLLVYIREFQWEQNQELRDSYRIRQEMFYPSASRPGFGWSVLWSWNQPKILEEFSKLSMAELGWFYEESEQERYVQYQSRSGYLDECENTDEVIIKVSMTKEVIGMYLDNGRLLTLDSSLSEPGGKVKPSPA